MSQLSPEVKRRQKIEKTIVRRVIRDALNAGYLLNVDNGGDKEELPKPTNKYKEIDKVMYATDLEHLNLYKDGKHFGQVLFVYGNDGWDVINDYSSKLEELLKGALDLSQSLDK